MMETLLLEQFLLPCKSNYFQHTLTEVYSEPSQIAKMEFLRK